MFAKGIRKSLIAFEKILSVFFLSGSLLAKASNRTDVAKHFLMFGEESKKSLIAIFEFAFFVWSF